MSDVRLGQLVGSSWGIFFRDRLLPGGKWYFWEHTSDSTRADAIDRALDGGYGGMQTMEDWRRMRKRGVVAAKRYSAYVVGLPE